jgi:hypothetical protein
MSFGDDTLDPCNEIQFDAVKRDRDKYKSQVNNLLRVIEETTHRLDDITALLKTRL